MTREEVLNSIQLKKRFCKDCNIPIALFDNPYFYERLVALDIIFHCVKQFNLFCAEMQRFRNEQEYFEHYNQVKDNMITDIKDNHMYQQFLVDDDVTTIPKQSVGNRNVYVEENDGKVFISIDMKKANFSALHFYSRDIFGCDTWEEYVSRFTGSTHIQNSKYIRQVVLGACNPKRQINYEKSLMARLYLHIKDTLNDDRFEAYSLNTDEIIISIDKFRHPLNELKDIIATCPSNIGSLVRVEMFELQKAGDYGWLKIIYDDSRTVQFKCIDAEIFHQVVKHYYNVPITDNDLVFRHNGRLARFLEEVSDPW